MSRAPEFGDRLLCPWRLGTEQQAARRLGIGQEEHVEFAGVTAVQQPVGPVQVSAAVTSYGTRLGEFPGPRQQGNRVHLDRGVDTRLAHRPTPESTVAHGELALVSRALQ